MYRKLLEFESLYLGGGGAIPDVALVAVSTVHSFHFFI
jgi:hypothetical protein